ncbi:MAG: hypothetical protein J6K74_04105 [Marinifilaceae bacterium]|nr:hypothetical protein [Marinifilaceae bacterium]
MKKLMLIVCAMCMMVGGAKAQSGTLDSKFGLDSLKTLQMASICSQYCKQKNYKDALNSWRYLFFNAPAFQMRTYINGEAIVKDALARTKDSKYVDTLMMIYDQRIKYFGKDPRYGEAYLLGKKGADLLRYRKSDRESVLEAYNCFVKSYEMTQGKTQPMVLRNMFNSAGTLMRMEAMETAAYVDLYMKLTDFLDNAVTMAKDPEPFKEAKGDIDAMFIDAGIADCEILTKVLSARYDANPTDVVNLKGIASILRRSECLDGELYANVAEALYAAEPDADAAYSLAILFGRRQDYDKMEEYLKAAIEKSDSEENKSEYYLKLASIKLSKNDYAEVKRLCLQALKGNPSSGEAYILIGKAYAAYAPKYGSEDFDHKTVFWAAVDKFQQAKRIDPSKTDEANRLIQLYSQHFPVVKDGFFNGLQEGDTFTIEGWINEKTIARFTKE